MEPHLPQLDASMMVEKGGLWFGFEDETGRGVEGILLVSLQKFYFSMVRVGAFGSRPLLGRSAGLWKGANEEPKLWGTLATSMSAVW